MKIDIVRSQALSGPGGSFGTMLIDGKPFCATCEQPWNKNLANQSCIPVGDYQLLPYDSPANGPTVVFNNPALGIYGTPSEIPAGQQGRSLCEIHIANWPFQLRGCVAVGQQVLDLSPNGMGVNNRAVTMDALKAQWGDRSGLMATISYGP